MAIDSLPKCMFRYWGAIKLQMKIKVCICCYIFSSSNAYVSAIHLIKELGNNNID